MLYWLKYPKTYKNNCKKGRNKVKTQEKKININIK